MFHFILLFHCCLIGGGYWTHNTYDFINKAHQAEAKVTGMKESRSTSSSGSGTSYTYAPIVKYEVHGKLYSHTSNMSSSHPTEKVGDMLVIYFSPNDPQEAMINRGIWNFLFQGILLITGVIILLVAIKHAK